MVTDEAGRIILMNEVAGMLTGWTAQEAMSERASALLSLESSSGRETPLDPVGEVLCTGRPVVRERGTTLVDRSGTRRSVALQSRPLKTMKGVVVLLRDTTETDRLEAEVLKHEKLESLGVLAGGIAHDFNNNLAGILGYLSLINEEPALSADIRDMVSQAQTAAIRSKDLTRQLLTFAKGGAPIKESASLSELIEDSVQFFLRGSSCRADLDIAPDLARADVDRNQFSQVIQDITHNAVEAMGGKGIFHVSARNVMVDVPPPGPLEPGPYVEILLQDEGPGIPAEYLDRIFDPFFTTKPKGSGLGLSIVYSIVRKHEGTIEVDSAPGRGTCFRILLRASRQNRPPRKGARKPVPTGQGRILLLDADATVLDMGLALLRRAGYQASAVQGGREAFEVWRAARETGRPFAAAILDLTIPGSMGGREVAKAIRAVDPFARLLASSGYSSGGLGEYSVSEWFDGLLPKPYTYADLCRVLDSVLVPSKP